MTAPSTSTATNCDLRAAAIEHAMRCTGDVAAVVRFADAFDADRFAARVALGRLVSSTPGAVPGPDTPLAAVVLGKDTWDPSWRLRVPAEPNSMWNTREQLEVLAGGATSPDPLDGYWELVERNDASWFSA